jgi:hypothetical protein
MDSTNEMTSLLKTILNKLSKDALIIIILSMGGYIINEKMKERDERRLYNEVRILNDVFELKQDVDSLKQR